MATLYDYSMLKVKSEMRASIPAALMVDPQSEPNYHGLIY